MKPLRVTNIQRGCVYDGPGVRTTVFLKGCPLRCPWCCNPETQSFDEEFFINDGKCLLLQGRVSEMCKSCERLDGNIAVNDCPFGVVENTSIDYDAEKLLQILLRDETLYKESNGGVTFSGGEPLYYIEELSDLIKQLKCRGINVVFETSLVAPFSYFEMLAGLIDCFIVDLKLQPQMKLYDTAYAQNIGSRLSLIDYAKLLFRIVFVNQMLDVKELVLNRLQQFGIGELELLLCHNLASYKYKKLLLESVDFSANIKSANIFADYLKGNNISVNILTV